MKKLFLVLISVALVSCTNTSKSEEYATSTEEVTTTAEVSAVTPDEDYDLGARKEIIIRKTTIGPFDCEYQGIVYTGKPQDTTFYVYLIFDNFKYQSIHDIGVRSFSVIDKKSEDLLEFADYLDSAKTTRGQTVTWKYIIQTHDFTKDIMINDGDDRYNYLTLAQANKMTAWIRSLGISK